MGTSDLRVDDYMTSPALTVGADTRLVSVQQLLQAQGISAVGVTDAGGALVGALSRSDLLRIGRVRQLDGPREALVELPDATAADAMTANPVTVAPDATLGAAGKLMVKNHIHRVFVKKGAQCVGLLSTSDVMRAICEESYTRPISEFATPGVVQVRSDDTIALALDRMHAAHVHGVVVMEGDWPIGVFAQPEALAAADAAPDAPVSDYLNPRFLVLPDEMPVRRAIEQALATRARRVVLTNGASLCGILSGPDFVRALT